MATRGGEESKESTPQNGTESTPTCGIVMPISSIDGCSSAHWLDVQAIIKESVEQLSTPHFHARIVSDADEVGVIQKRIVSNIYTSDIVVCDVSCKNPNVMFELGMRLAFDRPAVIIKDDKTDYSFDTSIIEHLTYPRDLRYTTMQTFKASLAEKVSSTYQKAKSDKGHSTFLKNFGTFAVANLSTQVANPQQISLELLEQMTAEMRMLRRRFDSMPITAEVRASPDHAVEISYERFRSVLRSIVRAYGVGPEGSSADQVARVMEFAKRVLADDFPSLDIAPERLRMLIRREFERQKAQP
jgi:hypothetical protein